MYVSIEPSGCVVRKGMVQVRLMMFLDPTDYGFDKHRVQVPIIPETGYPGEVGEMNQPKDPAQHKAWLDGLPKQWQTNPFHNHFIYCEPDVSIGEIEASALEILDTIYSMWQNDINPSVKNQKVKFISDPTPERVSDCEAKLNQIKQAGSVKWRP